MQVTDEMVRVARETFDNVSGSPLELATNDAWREALEAALAVDGMALVDQRALDWIFGEGPDRDGKWFGETIGDGVPKLAGKYPRTYWWRSKFRAMLAAASDREERR
jgi:hypothetical protein